MSVAQGDTTGADVAQAAVDVAPLLHPAPEHPDLQRRIDAIVQKHQAADQAAREGRTHA